ncbi:MAG TPA: hypothetical protein VKA16_08515, partial [Burkholderiales bacterium]|nr:hypothetical protein [Burkholderiales bacterium]
SYTDIGRPNGSINAGIAARFRRGSDRERPAVVDVTVSPGEVAMPPDITLSQAAHYGLAKVKEALLSGPPPLGTDPAALHRPGGYPKIGGFQPHSPTARRWKYHTPLIFRHVFPGTGFADDGSRGARRLQEAFESHASGLRVTEFRLSRPIER